MCLLAYACFQVKDFMPNIAVISMDNYNDGSKVVDSNFDGEGELCLCVATGRGGGVVRVAHIPTLLARFHSYHGGRLAGAACAVVWLAAADRLLVSVPWANACEGGLCWGLTALVYPLLHCHCRSSVDRL